MFPQITRRLHPRVQDPWHSSRHTVKLSVRESLSSSSDFESYPLSTIEAFKGDTFSNLGEEYASIIKPYEEYIYKIDSDRSKEFRENVWPDYTFKIWEDYKMLNGIDSLEEDAVKNSHRKILEELGYFSKDLANQSYTDDSNQEMREQQHVAERLKHIPPGENHKMVRDTEHHVSGMMSNIYKRTHPLKYSPTVIASGGGGTWGYHYKQERGKLTNRERARIQTFPDDFMFYGKNAEVRKQIGNAVPPLGAKRVGECLLELYNIIEE